MRKEPEEEVILEPIDENEVGMRLKTLTTLIHRRLNSACRGNDNKDVTGMGVWLLGYLIDAEKADKDIFQKDLENYIHIRRATVSKMIGLMERKGYISRCSVQSDARLKKLTATEKGKQLFESTTKQVESVELIIKKDIPPEKLAVFIEVCELIKKNLLSEEEKQT